MKNIRVVKIKTWDRMEKEFGLSIDHNINCENVFNKDMERFLPKNRIIILKDKNKWFVENNPFAWYISNDMIEEELDPKDYPQYFI
jgi:hypothetical protein